MTDCSSIQGSTTSSSSDVTTLTTASSSWCSISTSSRIRVIRLVRPHPRRILVTPNNSASYGFSVRGGKEFGTGFFVSNIERFSEADHKGLKIGDQIIRVNGYRIEDAVHKELVQFITSQDRLTLKVRGVGVMPMKEKENDALTWHAVRTAPASISSSDDSIKSAPSQRSRSKDMRIVLNVAPRTKLGLGICKGPEWKPGIFVQFTKEKSVARESGLRPGDQILCVNSIDFSDVLFSEAVAVMKSATKLDMVVRTAAGCDLFPGESSGYNSSASSVTGDQSPCWADVSSKRLTVVCEETSANSNDHLYAEVKKSLRLSESQDKCLSSSSSSDTGTLKEFNKTIIKLSENGTSINNTFIENALVRDEQKPFGSNDCLKPIPPPPPPLQSNTANSSDKAEGSQKLGNICLVSRQSETKTVFVEVHRSDTSINTNKKLHQQLRFVPPSEQSHSEKTVRKQGVEEQIVDAGGSKGESNPPSGGNTLCSAIAEELRKRKEKQRQNSDNQTNHIPNAAAQISDLGTLGHNESNLSTKIKSTNKRQGGGGGSGYHPTQGNGMERKQCDDKHSALMNEFKRAHQRMFKNGFHENDHKERQDKLRNTIVKDFNEDQRNINTQPNVRENKMSPAVSTNDQPTSYVNTNIQNGQSSYSSQSLTKTIRTESHSKPPDSPTPDYEPVLVQSTPKKMQIYSNVQLRNDATTTINDVTNGNRRTMRLGTVTIGEYSQEQQKEPSKFDFLEKRASKDANRFANADGTVTLRAELQDTLSRSNLRKTTSFSFNDDAANGGREIYEHQKHCKLQNIESGYSSNNMSSNNSNINSNNISNSNNNNNNNNTNKEYTNVEKLTRMLQNRQPPSDSSSQRPMSTITMRSPQPMMSNQQAETYSNGILKNGTNSRSNRTSFAKTSEKSISFGN